MVYIATIEAVYLQINGQKIAEIFADPTLFFKILKNIKRESRKAAAW
jgi:hypothetical protein|tara:strand:+ start:19605 stop:19745 length:141 start_codon:yes stop_codon:yes gene_type:complete